MTKRVDLPGHSGDHAKPFLGPSQPQSHLVDRVLVINRGFVGHAPAGVEELDPPLLDLVSHQTLHGVVGTSPPHVQEGHLYYGEFEVLVHRQLGDHVIESVLDSSPLRLLVVAIEVVARGLQPPHVVMGVRNQVHSGDIIRVIPTNVGRMFKYLSTAPAEQSQQQAHLEYYLHVNNNNVSCPMVYQYTSAFCQTNPGSLQEHPLHKKVDPVELLDDLVGPHVDVVLLLEPVLVLVGYLPHHLVPPQEYVGGIEKSLVLPLEFDVDAVNAARSVFEAHLILKFACDIVSVVFVGKFGGGPVVPVVLNFLHLPESPVADLHVHLIEWRLSNPHLKCTSIQFYSIQETYHLQIEGMISGRRGKSTSTTPRLVIC